jgi:hypothetical protein
VTNVIVIQAIFIKYSHTFKQQKLKDLIRRSIILVKKYLKVTSKEFHHISDPFRDTKISNLTQHEIFSKHHVNETR